jgi:hypothetical protein
MSKLPAARQLDNAAVARLLEVALQQGGPGFVYRLLAFPAAEQFSADMVSQLLHALLERGVQTAGQGCSAAVQASGGSAS